MFVETDRMDSRELNGVEYRLTDWSVRQLWMKIKNESESRSVLVCFKNQRTQQSMDSIGSGLEGIFQNGLAQGGVVCGVDL